VNTSRNHQDHGAWRAGFYQGSELWELNLVDPDNRRQVDYAMRRATLAGLSSATPTDLLEQRADGRVKMFVTSRALAARAELRGLYEEGDYVPLKTSGARSESLFAFARTMPGSASTAITCVPRLVASLTPDGTPPIGCGVWIDTRIELPAALTVPARFRDVFTGAIIDVEPAGGTATIPAAAIFERFPVALLVPCSI
jgi:(1->4)-alpha-D-glucan 1-alpha-D-glucosylmutase